MQSSPQKYETNGYIIKPKLFISLAHLQDLSLYVAGFNLKYLIQGNKNISLNIPGFNHGIIDPEAQHYNLPLSDDNACDLMIFFNQF